MPFFQSIHGTLEHLQREQGAFETVKENGVVHRSTHSIIAILPEALFKQVHERQRILIGGGSFTERIYHERLKKALLSINRIWQRRNRKKYWHSQCRWRRNISM